VSVEVNRNADLFFQGLDQLVSGHRFQETRHILNSQNMGSPLFQFLGHANVVIQIILLSGLVENIAGVADAGFCNLTLIQRLIESDFHTLNPVERVKDTEDVDARSRRNLDKLTDYIIRIVLIAHCIGPPDQHLEHDIWNLRPKSLQSFPRRFLQEPVGSIKGGSSPHLQGKHLLAVQRHCRRNLFHIYGSDSGCHQRLLRVAHGRIGDQKFLLFQSPFRHCFRAFLVQHLLRSGQDIDLRHRDSREYRNIKLRFYTFCLINYFISYVIENFQFPVFRFTDVQQLRIGFNKSGIAVSFSESRMVEHVEQKSDVGLYALDLRLTKSAHSLSGRSFKGVGKSSQLDKQAVVVRGNHRSGKSVAAIQTDSVSGSAPIELNRSSIRGKAVGRIFCGNSALYRIAVQPDILLIFDSHFVGIERITLSDENLRLHDIDSSNNFRHRVLHLNPRVHLNEVVVSMLIQQEFHSTGASVVDRPGDLQRVFTDGVSLLFAQAQRRRELDNLLMSPLDRAVSFTQMYHVAVPVAQHLYFYVFRAFQVFFDKDIVNTERLFRFALGASVFRNQVLFASDDTHTSSAAAGCRLEHDRISALSGKLLSFLF